MFEIYFIIAALLIFNLYTHDQINKDGAYFLDEEKPKFILMVWLVPFLGSIIAQQRLHADRMFYLTVIGIFAILRFGIYYLMFGVF